jgi:hypothetical protein
MTGERLFADVLDCFVPRNDERASDDGGMTGERLFANVLDCFVPRNDECASDDGGMAGERLFANVLDCFVPRNDGTFHTVVISRHEAIQEYKKGRII